MRAYGNLGTAYNFALFNAKSVRNRAMAYKVYVVDKNIDILALTKTWLRPGNCDDLVHYVLMVIDFFMSQERMEEEEEWVCFLKIH